MPYSLQAVRDADSAIDVPYSLEAVSDVDSVKMQGRQGREHMGRWFVVGWRTPPKKISHTMEPWLSTYLTAWKL